MANSGPTSATVNSAYRVFSTDKLVVEGNIVELATGSNGAIAVHVHDNATAALTPDYAHGEVIIRNNKVRYLDGSFDASNAGYALHANGAKSLLPPKQRGGVRAGQSDPQPAEWFGVLFQQQNAGRRFDWRKDRRRPRNTTERKAFIDVNAYQITWSQQYYHNDAGATLYGSQFRARSHRQQHSNREHRFECRCERVREVRRHRLSD
jgi:hypothetical protein